MDTNALKKFAQDARQTLKKTIATKLNFVLANESLARRENLKAVTELENRIRKHSKDLVIEEVAYTWFNRFSALQFMDVNGYNRVRVIASADNQTRPEILSDANSGVFDNKIISENTRQKVTALLDGRSASNDPDNEAYRLLLVSVCNYFHSSMPFMFERIADFTELLLPEDMLSPTSILSDLRKAMTVDNCRDVEVIGWLYQFYISEKKDEVRDLIKKNYKVIPENIPAVTQIFTPNWIVKFLVQNSLGRLWMLNNPYSSLVNKMEYYIKPDDTKIDFAQITSPEEIKICDPACGSGHMLTYSFDLLYKIYEEKGYNESSIPTLILQKNLYGIELDKRAGELAAFALTMKAREKQRSFFSNPIKPNICMLENIFFEPNELKEYSHIVEDNIFDNLFLKTLTQFEESNNFGSLIKPAMSDIENKHNLIKPKTDSNNLFIQSTHHKISKILHYSEYLSKKYQVVVANPPYMGEKGMNARLKGFLQVNYNEFKINLFSAFISRITDLVIDKGMIGLMTPHVWMYIYKHEKLRQILTKNLTITNLVELPLGAFKGASVQISAFTLDNYNNKQKGNFIRLVDFEGSDIEMAKYTKQAINNNKCGWFYSVFTNDFRIIPGFKIAYWSSLKTKQAFSNFPPISSLASIGKGLDTGNNDKYLKLWWEIKIFDSSWVPCQKGGGYRKWYGNNEYKIFWKNNGKSIILEPKSNVRNSKNYFREGLTWTKIATSSSFRYFPEGHIFENTGPCLFPNDGLLHEYLTFLNSKVSLFFLSFIAPSLDFQSGDISKIPFNKLREPILENNYFKLLDNAKNDWNSFEKSWDFNILPLLSPDHCSTTLQKTYNSLRTHWQEMTDEMFKLEEENNRIFIDAYGLQDELTPDVPIHEVTLTCNPAYRYGQKVSKEDQETRLLADTMKEFMSYSVGCMFGRYALEEPGLILANGGDTIETYLSKIPNPKFPADDDNVIPILNAEWFEDDIVGRFRKFLRITFGDDNFEENLNFIETAIGRSIRDYFTKDFYKDHVKTYKKRPIYWQFSSPKGSFNALIYMHRYNRDTVSTILNSYLRDYQSKLTAEKTAQERIEVSATSNAAEKTKALKEIQSITSILNELEEWERDVIFPLASQRIEIDLDDGVKVNYPKFGSALAKVTGLS